MHPERYEPYPYVIPEPIVHPKHIIHPPPQRYKQPRRTGRSTKILGGVLWFLVGAGSFAAIWLLLMHELGTVTGSPALDIFLLFAGIAIFFCGDILSDFNRRFAEKYCGQWGRKGGT